MTNSHTIKLNKHEEDIRRARLGSSDSSITRTPSYTDIVALSTKFFIDQHNACKYVENNNKSLSVSSDAFMEVMKLTKQDKVFVSGEQTIPFVPYSPSTSPVYTNSRSSSPFPQSISSLSSSAPLITNPALNTPQLPAATSVKFDTTPKSSPTQTPTLLRRFYDLMKYINLPDVLNGLENFGYLTSDQSIGLFECMEILKSDHPELAKVLQYEERPVCTVQHFGIICDACGVLDICGTRYKCAICPEYNMCEKCERKGMLTHDITHPRIKMIVPSNCTFEHSCKMINSQGELIEKPCSHISGQSATTYEKRQLQFTALLKKKQMRNAMLKVHAQQEAQRQKEEEQKREADLASKKQAEILQQQTTSVLSSYFENLKKQNKLQSITVIQTSTAATTTPNTNSPIAISGSLAASTSSTSSRVRSALEHTDSCSSIPSISSPTLSSRSASPCVISPTPTSPSSSSSTPSPSCSSPARARCLSLPSSRLKMDAFFSPISPQCSPMFGNMELNQSVGSPPMAPRNRLRRSQSVEEPVKPALQKANQTPEKRGMSLVDIFSFGKVLPDLQPTPPASLEKDISGKELSASELADVMRQMGLASSSGASRTSVSGSSDSVRSEASESEERPNSLKKKSESTNIFASFRDFVTK